MWDVNPQFSDAAGQYAGKQASGAVSMDIAFVITLPIKLVQRDSGCVSDADLLTAQPQDYLCRRRHKHKLLRYFTS